MAPRFSVLTCPVEWVDDPHPVGREAAWIVGRLLVEHSVIGPQRSQLLGDEGVGDRIARVHHLPGVGTGCEHFGSPIHQPVPGFDREAHGELSVGLTDQCGCVTHGRPV